MGGVCSAVQHGWEAHRRQEEQMKVPIVLRASDSSLKTQCTSSLQTNDLEKLNNAPSSGTSTYPSLASCASLRQWPTERTERGLTDQRIRPLFAVTSHGSTAATLAERRQGCPGRVLQSSLSSSSATKSTAPMGFADTEHDDWWCAEDDVYDFTFSEGEPGGRVSDMNDAWGCEPSYGTYIWNDDDDDDDETATTISLYSPSISAASRSYASVLPESDYPSLAAASALSKKAINDRSSSSFKKPKEEDNITQHVGRQWVRFDRSVDSHTLVYRPSSHGANYSFASEDAFGDGVTGNNVYKEGSQENKENISWYDPGYHPGRRFQVIPSTPRAKVTKAQRAARRSSKNARDAKFQLHVLMKEERAAKWGH